MMRQGLASIITPCYNSEAYIKETIESVISQTYTDWEMLIVDDGSTDRSADIIRLYAEKDSRIRLLTQENRGSAAARNHGLKLAEGQYIALLDADDVWLPKFLEEQIRFMKEKDAVCVYCSYGRINHKSEDILSPVRAKARITSADMMVMNHIGCLSGLYDCSKYGKIYLREELKSIRDDYAYWMDIVRLENAAYGNPEMLAKYRILSDSVTGKKTKLIWKQYQFYRKYLKQNPLQGACHVIWWGCSGIFKFSR